LNGENRLQHDDNLKVWYVDQQFLGVVLEGGAIDFELVFLVQREIVENGNARLARCVHSGAKPHRGVIDACEEDTIADTY